MAAGPDVNILDRIIASVSPETGLRRAAARQFLESYQERYAAAKHGRRNRGWGGRATSANVETGTAMATLRNRAREFVRDSWQGQRILDVLVSHVVGTGITVIPNTGSDRADRAWRLAWEEWMAVSDAEGVLSFEAQQALSLRSMIEGGDSVVRFIDIKPQDAGGTVPFRLLVLEGDQIDSTRDRAIGAGTARLGVELGEWGRRVGLWLHQEHPGDMSLSAVMASRLIAWDDLVHLYRPLRIGQVRGITWFAPVLLSGKELQDLFEAAIVQQRTQASFAGFIKHNPAGLNPLAAKPDAQDGSKKVSRIEPGMIADIGDSDIVFANPSGQSAFAEAYLAGLQAMAAGAGLTYDQLSGDLRQANYSSLRAGKIEFRRLVEQIQWHIMGPRYCMPVARRFTERAIMFNRLATRKDGYRLDLVMPAVEPIDPKKDLEADVLAVRAGRMSPQEFVSAWGRDWRQVVEDFQSFFAMVDKGPTPFSFDIDPRRPANGVAAAPDVPPAADAA